LESGDQVEVTSSSVNFIVLIMLVAYLQYQKQNEEQILGYEKAQM